MPFSDREDDATQIVDRAVLLGEGGHSVSHEHILTKDKDGAVWVIVREGGKMLHYPFRGRTSHNGQEERTQFETFVANLPKDNSWHWYAYEGEEATLHEVRIFPYSTAHS
jgi:hypothetical protein